MFQNDCTVLHYTCMLLNLQARENCVHWYEQKVTKSLTFQITDLHFNQCLSTVPFFKKFDSKSAMCLWFIQHLTCTSCLCIFCLFSVLLCVCVSFLFSVFMSACLFFFFIQHLTSCLTTQSSRHHLSTLQL